MLETGDVPRGNTYDKYATTNPIEQRLMERFLSSLDAAIGAGNPLRILEVGAGEGEIATRIRSSFPDAHLTVLDLPDDEVANSWASFSLSGLFASVEALPFEDNTFDLVLAIEVLEHVDNPDAALVEISRVANNRVVLTVPREPIWRVGNLARGRYVRDLGNTPGHINHWGLRSFRQLVARHMTVTSARGSFPWSVVSASVR